MKNRIESNMDIVHKIAWKYHRSSGIDIVDLVAEGYHALCYADKKFDDSRGEAKFTTYAYTAVQSRIINLVKKEARIGFYEMGIGPKESITLPSQFVDDENEVGPIQIPDPNPIDIEARIGFIQQIRSLSDLAQRAYTLVVDKSYDTKSSLKLRLKKEGHSRGEIIKAFTELSEALR